ncbi:MAG TPA: peptidoglycan recognition family protein [Lacunisphaera sp.]|nr:peptidoglycan recognition family protein [Lacunisphaera sp.]
MSAPRARGSWRRRAAPGGWLLVVLGVLAGCRTDPRVASPSLPDGNTFIVAGQRFDAGTPVVTWLAPEGYNAYASALPNHGRRMFDGQKPTDPAPSLGALRRHLDQFVLHYDTVGVSRACFQVLQRRGLSAHFLLDVDGTIYQTLDLQERAWHAGSSNDRSIGIEMASLGAYPPDAAGILSNWYRREPTGQVRLVPPASVGNPRLRTPDFRGRPQRPDAVRGRIHGQDLVQYDFTPEQYAALIKLTAALHRVFPRIELDYPRDDQGRLVEGKLPDEALAKFRGVLGHYHLQFNKVDPGPAFQWDPVINGARREQPSARKPDQP